MKFIRRHDLDPQTRIDIVRHVWRHQGLYGKSSLQESKGDDSDCSGVSHL